MPVLESTEKITPKSIVRHRPIGEPSAPVGKRNGQTTMLPPIAQRASRPQPASTDEEVMEWRHRNTDAASRARIKHPALGGPPRLSFASWMKRRGLSHIPPFLYLGLGMGMMLMLWIVCSMIFGWFTTFSDDLRYGRPRTFQVDAWVGHNEQNGIPSHFVALNLHRHIEIIEICGAEAAHTRIYTGPQLYGPHDDLVPVTLNFIDVNGDQKPDMLINFQGSRVVFINDGEHFRPVLPSERRQIDQFLQQHLG